MFLLKETWNDFSQIRNRPARGNNFWRRMRMQTCIIDEVVFNQKKDITYEEIFNRRNEDNVSIAYVNLKKKAEKEKGKDKFQSNKKDIFYYVEKDHKELIRQIDLINPNIIMCSGTLEYCKKLYNNLEPIPDSNGLYKTEDRNFVFIEF